MTQPTFLVNYRELRVYQTALEAAVQVFELSQSFPLDEQEYLTYPLLQATRLLCVHIAQAWLRRRYGNAFVARLNRAEAEAAAAQVWIELAVLSHHLDPEQAQPLHHQYWQVLRELDRLIQHSAAWVNPA